MSIQKHLSYRLFTPMRLCFVAVILLVMVVLWQQAVIYRRSRALAELLRENAQLKENIVSIDGQIKDLRDTASDVRVFQRELVRVIKDIDKNYPISFASYNRADTGKIGDIPHYNTQDMLNTANQGIFQLSSSQNTMRFETASLLGRAVSIREILAQTPSMIPVLNGYVSSEFGKRHDPFTKTSKMHFGLDFAAPKGTPVFASADGMVVTATRKYDFGNLIELQHANGYSTAYAHLSQILVKKGERVRRGQEIGRVGNTGSRCAGDHVHFEVRKNGVRQDPGPFLKNSLRNFS